MLGTRAAYVVAEGDGQEDALRSGRRPDDPETWGIEPESRWGRLVKGEESEAVPSERGAWPTFYAELERALRAGGPPPVDPADAVATLEVIDAARRSAAEGRITELPALDLDLDLAWGRAPRHMRRRRPIWIGAVAPTLEQAVGHQVLEPREQRRGLAREFWSDPESL